VLPALAREQRRPRPQWPILALAASLLLVAGLSYLGFHAWRGAAGPAAPGARMQASAGAVAPLEVDQSGGRCRLVLGDGAAFFDVTPNPDRSLAAPGDETRVRMYDTAFSVRPEPAGVLVTVTGGSIEVSVGNAARVLTSGQQLRCRAGDAAGPHPDGAARSSGMSAALTRSSAFS
jgi:ferric-dicitrate binding protein FerR (iron transport regulator)